MLDLNLDKTKHTLRLHDVVRTYLQHEIGTDGLVTLNAQLLDAYHLSRWADLPPDEPYLWTHLATHLINAGRTDTLVMTVKNLRYLAAKTLASGVVAMEQDLQLAVAQTSTDTTLQILGQPIPKITHLLSRGQTLDEIEATLVCRLSQVESLKVLCEPHERKLARPWLAAWHPLPDLPNPALVRTLWGHTGPVNGCAVSPDGTWIVSASRDETLKLWDVHEGHCVATFYADGALFGCAFHPDGTHLVAVGA